LNKRPNPDKNPNRHRRRRRGGGGGQKPEPVVEQAVPKKAPPKLKRYAIVFYENHAQAREDSSHLGELRDSCDQLNIVIKAEGSMEDPELLQYGKIYAGEAWTLIHKRRVDDGWYNDLHE
jgi:hypothetical protein